MTEKVPQGEKLEQRVHRQYLLREAEHFKEHKLGIPEWLKNSDDSYTRHEDKDSKFPQLPIIINFGRNEVMCLDFGGAEGDKIIEHVPYYGSPDAASQGKKLKKEVSGGHGNGGKYYGLAQFKECQVINYYNGKLTMLTLKKDGDYVNYKNYDTDPKWIIKFLGLDNWKYFNTQSRIFDALKDGKLNLFCWRGIEPKDSISNKREINKLINTLAKNSQARYALRTRMVDVLLYGDLFYHELRPTEIIPDDTIPPKEFVLPNKLGKYEFNKQRTSILKVVFSKIPLTGEDSSLNILDILSNQKPIGFYNIPSLLLDKGISRFMYAEIDCPELKEYNAVSNDRTALVPNDAGNIFLQWCKDRLQDVLSEQTNKEMRKEEDKNLDKVSEFVNEVVKDLYDLLEEDILTKLYDQSGTEKGEVLVPTEEPGGFGSGGKGGRGKGKRRGKLEIGEVLVDNKPKKSVLRILISNKSDDPLHTGQTYNMVERQPILYQRQEDLPYGIWWINSQKEYVRKLKVDQPAGRAFFCFLVKEIVLSNTYRKESQTGIDPDKFEEIDFDLIDKIFNKVVKRLSIEISEENINEKIRETIRNKTQFTTYELAEEIGIDAGYISVFLNNEKNNINNSFKIKKVPNPCGKGPAVNMYIKK